MKKIIFAVLFSLSFSALAQDANERCKQIAESASQASYNSVAHDFCGYSESLGVLTRTRVVANKCEFELRYQEKFTSCDGMQPARYVSIRLWAMKSVKKACEAVGFKKFYFSRASGVVVCRE